MVCFNPNWTRPFRPLRKDMIRVVLIALILSVSATACAQLPSPILGVADGPGGRILASKTAEWDGEWVSVSSRIDDLERRGIFQRAAAAAHGPAADDFRRAFLKRFSSDIGRVRIVAGRFTFLSPDDSTVIGTALYAYAGFVEQMSEGREIQWHRFFLTSGFGKYPILVCSEPYGVLGQWMLVSGDFAAGMTPPHPDSGEKRAMMVPADLSAEALNDALDTPEFVSFLRTLPIPEKKEERADP